MQSAFIVDLVDKAGKIGGDIIEAFDASSAPRLKNRLDFCRKGSRSSLIPRNSAGSAGAILNPTSAAHCMTG
jgi:hypothetical protein